MAYTLQQLSDFEDIRTLKHRYFRAVDTADQALLASVLTEDVDIHYRGGNYVVKLTGRDAMVDFIANSFNTSLLAMHHGHLPEITLTGPDTAEGIWALEDIVIKIPTRENIIGSAIYHDVYRREDGQWKIARSEYDRVMEYSVPFPEEGKILAHYLGKHGRKMEECGDVSRVLQFDPA